MLVRGRSFPPADAAGRRRLPVPGLPAGEDQASKRRGFAVTGEWNVGAVLLDMDGTLLDTEKVYFESLIAALHACGYRDDVVPLCHAMVGLPGPDCERMLIDRYGDDFPLAEVNKAFVAKRDEFFRASLPLKHGTIELLDALQADAALVTAVIARSVSDEAIHSFFWWRDGLLRFARNDVERAGAVNSWRGVRRAWPHASMKLQPRRRSPCRRGRDARERRRMN